MKIKMLVVLLCGIASIAFGGLENAKVVHHSGGLPGTMQALRVVEGVVGQTERHRGRNGALNAIAMHDSPRATQILERFSVGNGDRELRGQAVFWIAQTGGRRGFEVARRLANDDADREIRKK